jgi:hypothetical protein
MATEATDALYVLQVSSKHSRELCAATALLGSILMQGRHSALIALLGMWMGTGIQAQRVWRAAPGRYLVLVRQYATTALRERVTLKARS